MWRGFAGAGVLARAVVEGAAVVAVRVAGAADALDVPALPAPGLIAPPPERWPDPQPAAITARTASDADTRGTRPRLTPVAVGWRSRQSSGARALPAILAQRHDPMAIELEDALDLA